MSSSASSAGSGANSNSAGYVLTMIDNQTDQMLLLKEGRGMWRQEMRYRIEAWSTVVIRLELHDASRQGALIMYNVDDESGEDDSASPVYVPIDQLLCHKRIVVCWKKGRYLWIGQTR